MMRVAWKIGIEIEAQSDAHAETHGMSMVMEYVRPRCTSCLRSGGRMSTSIAPCIFRII